MKRESWNKPQNTESISYFHWIPHIFSLINSPLICLGGLEPFSVWWAWTVLCFIPTFYIQTYSPSFSMSSKRYSKVYQSLVQIKMSILLEGNTEIEETVCNWVVAKTYSFQNYLPYRWKWLYHNFVFGAFLSFGLYELCSLFFILVNVVCYN